MFLFRGFEILNFSLKVLIKVGSFKRISTVVYEGLKYDGKQQSVALLVEGLEIL